MERKFFDKLAAGKFGKYIIPGIVFQSVLIAGGYATGREVVQYGARFGAMGYWGAIAIFVGFSIISILTFELARIFKAYNYRSFAKQILWKFWPIYEILYVAITILVLAIIGSATGSILNETLGWPYWAGVILVIVVVGILTFYGRGLIERYKTIGTILLYGGYITFAVIVLSQTWGHVTHEFAIGDTSFVGPVGMGTILWIGLLYVGYNSCCEATTLFTLDRQTERKHTILGGIIAGALTTIPFILTYLCILGFYPSEEVLGAPVPWLRMLNKTAGSEIIVLYGIVIAWTFIETGTGFIHAITERINANLQELGKKGLSRKQNAAIAVGILALATILSKIGIIALVAKGYTYMAYGFIIFFIVPLVTIGIVRIMKPNWNKELWAKA
jgi:uncharacterized membrane protein YkvI